MIPSPQTPLPAGKGKLHQMILEAKRAAAAARLVGPGVSYGPLGTTIRRSRKVRESTGTGAVWL